MSNRHRTEVKWCLQAQ